MAYTKVLQHDTLILKEKSTYLVIVKINIGNILSQKYAESNIPVQIIEAPIAKKEVDKVKLLMLMGAMED